MEALFNFKQSVCTEFLQWEIILLNVPVARKKMGRSRSRERERRRSRSRERERRHRDRSRSRSPHRSRRSRSRERDRERRRERGGERDRDRRSTSPSHRRHRRGRSQSPSSRHGKDRDRRKDEQVAKPAGPVGAAAAACEDPTVDAEAEMMKVMGFSNFDTTKGKSVQGTDVSAALIRKERRYRQYMNRRGGFNRPLDFIQ
ncbi:U4/U6.U5 small nuclear ribonucleoprotein 27 kDa protein-like [Sycon ciliatum]|uniref:U4/U6.U5 small nuclear ribonucleoprotein 27 kDa protein-like n=1 Tax=Sycon ciliatum TaxID=27933 RepID=UPI0031F6FA7A